MSIEVVQIQNAYDDHNLEDYCVLGTIVDLNVWSMVSVQLAIGVGVPNPFLTLRLDKATSPIQLGLVNREANFEDLRAALLYYFLTHSDVLGSLLNNGVYIQERFGDLVRCYPMLDGVGVHYLDEPYYYQTWIANRTSRQYVCLSAFDSSPPLVFWSDLGDPTVWFIHGTNESVGGVYSQGIDQQFSLRLDERKRVMQELSYDL